MRIQNNITAMNTHRMYTANNNAISKSAEKLSSGYRINRAGDDAAGLAISEKMRSQIRGLNMASKNSQDANSLIQTAEGALQEVHSMLQRMGELANQSATGTNENFDRTQISAEFDQLKEEINDISEQTNFNNMKLLDGSLASGNSGAKYSAGDMKVNGLIATNFTITGQTGLSDQIGTYSFATVSAAEASTIGATEANAIKVSFTDSKTGNVTNTIVDLSKAAPDVAANTAFKLDLSASGMGTFDITSNADGDDVAALKTELLAAGTAGVGALVTEAKDPAVDAAGTGGLKIQVGANENEQLTISVEKMNVDGLNLTDAKIDTQDNAGKAITSTQKAINMVSEQRATLGAMQNRLEHKISNLDNTSENLSASEARIRDVDIAKEMTNFTKNQILSQAATAMLAQANSMPQNVLSLLQ
ncbi:MAG: flagellin [Clostridia bacterium]|nr:flagellin [Clostridia bacterium]